MEGTFGSLIVRGLADPNTDDPYEGICASGLTDCVDEPDTCEPQFLPGDLPEDCLSTGTGTDEDCDGLVDEADPDCDDVSFHRLPRDT